MLDETCSQNASLDNVDQFSSDTNRRQFENHGFQDEHQTNKYQYINQQSNICDYDETDENNPNMKKYNNYDYSDYRHVDKYRGEEINARQLYESEGNTRYNTESCPKTL